MPTKYSVVVYTKNKTRDQINRDFDFIESVMFGLMCTMSFSVRRQVMFN